MGFLDRLTERGDAVRALKGQYVSFSDYELKSIVNREGSRNSMSREAHAAFMVLQDRGYSVEDIKKGY